VSTSPRIGKFWLFTVTSSLQIIFFYKPVIRQATDMEALWITIRNTYMTYTDPHVHNPSSDYPFPRESDFVELTGSIVFVCTSFSSCTCPHRYTWFSPSGPFFLQLSPGYARIFWEQSIQECTVIIWANHQCRLWSYEAEITGLSWLVYKVVI